MNHVLITGMSGVGKTSVINELRNRQFLAIDMDEPVWSYVDDAGHQRWQVMRLQEALSDQSPQEIFVSGCSEDQVRFYPQFSAIILLSAPKDVMQQRLRTRTNNPYGKSTAELREIMKSLDVIEPLLRKRCTHEIITTEPVYQVVDRILEISHIARGST